MESSAPQLGGEPPAGDAPQPGAPAAGREVAIDDAPPTAPASPSERAGAAPASKSIDQLTPDHADPAPMAHANCAELKSTKGRGSFTHAANSDWFDGIVDVVAYPRGPMKAADGTTNTNLMELRFSSTPPAYAEARASNANDSYWGVWFQRPAGADGPLTPGDYPMSGGYGGGSTCNDHSGQGGSSTFGYSPPHILTITKVDGATIEGTFHHFGSDITFKAPLVAPATSSPASASGPWVCCQ